MSTDSLLESADAARSDPEAFLQEAMRWHFGPDTASRFWLDRLSLLDFDPRVDVKTFEDLKHFPNFTNDLRDVPVEDLIPRGYGPRPPVSRVVESGGTTGAPKRVIILQDWWELLVEQCVMHHDLHRLPRDTKVLALVPGGPHAASEQWRTVHGRRGSMSLSIDVDPRWVKKLVASGRPEEVGRYVEHIVDQAEHHLLTQNVEVVGGTPPMIAALLRRDALLERMQERVKAITWGGAHMDADTRHLYRTEIFPGVKLVGGYGTTMALGGGAMERVGLTDDDPCILDPFSPFVTFAVVDPATLEPVPVGERGQLLVNHVSKSFFLPNNLERDEALRIATYDGHVGDSIADITPVTEFEGATTIEGVY